MLDLELINEKIEQARALSNSRRFKEAEKMYSDTLNQLDNLCGGDPEFPETVKLSQAQIYNNRGLCKYLQVCFDEAVEDYTQAILLDPTLAAAYYNRGTIHYRLCAGMSEETGERLALHHQATKDFQEAVRLAPDNLEFQKGLENCRAMSTSGIGDEEAKILVVDDIPVAKLVKLLFLLDNGDETTGTTEATQKQNADAAREALKTFLSFLKDKEKKNGAQQVLYVLLKRAKYLLDYPFLSLPSGTEAEVKGVRKEAEDLLTLSEACRYLKIKHQHLDEKIKEVQDKMKLTENERKGSFYVYAENLLMEHLCDDLTPNLVLKLFNIMKKDGSLHSEIDRDLCVTLNQLELEDGLKEALFFYMIRLLESCNILNRLYTDKLQDLLKELHKQSISVKEQQIITDYICMLGNYPGECQPAGICVVFCVTEGREGADTEIAKIKSVFQDILGFTMKIEKNPSISIIEEYERELQNPKYRYYDSIIFWFVSHGTETELILPNNEKYIREKFIDNFSMLNNFRKKPKIFFMATCRGNEPIPISQTGEHQATTDGKHGSYVYVPESAHDIESVYYQMDRLVANATLPSKLAFRFKDEGSVFVDIVCSLMEKNCGKNITQVLEEVCRKIHRIIFTSEEEEFKGNAKQACFYESTFQKTFILPKCS